jgi:hypothetical protein
MPAAVYHKLNYSALEPTPMCLQLPDQSVRYPLRIAENIPVKIREFFVLVDFAVLDMHPDSKVSLILERLFFSTGNAHIDVGKGEIKFTISRQEERFTFKPRPEQCLILECHEKQEVRSSSSGPEINHKE